MALLAFMFAIPWVASPASATHSTFDTSNDGWVIVSYPFQSHVGAPGTAPLPFDGVFGAPPGSVRIGDVFGETGISAPPEYLGNRSALYGDTLSYDIFIRFTDAVAYPAVVLNGGDQSVYYIAPSPPLDAWEHRVVPLTEAGWRTSGTGVAATEAQFRAVLQNLVGLYIYTEWNTGSDDTNLDNVSVGNGTTAVPQPPSAAVVAMRAWPNPFTSRTSISLVAARAGSGDLQILNVAGRLVRRLAIPAEGSGQQTIVWDGMDRNGKPVAPGLYFCRVGSASDGRVVRLTLLR